MACVHAFGASAPGEEVAVIYNTEVAESRQVAEHYAARRGVPEKHLIGLPLPRSEQIERRAFTEELQDRLLSELELRGLARSQGQRIPAREGTPAGVARVILSSQVRYLVLCYGVPLRIAQDRKLTEPVAEKLPASLRRNEAAVDSELACLPLLVRRAPLTGPIQNAFYASTNFAGLHPTNGLFMVTRLDGPSARVAMGLVDRALHAETNGLWGRAFFDLRSITNAGYVKGDEWIRTASEAVRKQGFETVVDDKPSTFPAWFPMPQIALYAGWYDNAVSGPFTREPVEFMPGAVAYHLHSFSATTIRDGRARWVGPLLERGVTATLGCVAEPYLDLSPDVGLFFTFLISIGANLGEAAYICQPALSWQTTVVGDPLYRPMARPPAELHAELERTGGEGLAWSHLRVVNLNLANGAPAAEIRQYLQGLALTRTSAVLSQKLGDLFREDGQMDKAIASYRSALATGPSPNQRIELQFALIELLLQQRKQAEALEVYEAFFSENPDYPGALRFFQKALPIARKVGDGRLVSRYETEIQRLSPPASPATNEARPKP